MYALLALVEQKHGLALLPSHYLDQHPNALIHRLPDIQLSEMLSFIYPIELELDPVIEAWRTILEHIKTHAVQM